MFILCAWSVYTYSFRYGTEANVQLYFEEKYKLYPKFLLYKQFTLKGV